MILLSPRGMPCEIQIRSMLQHVYSEVTHKSIYKYKLIEPTNSMRRDVARSMALLETADHLLSEVRTHAESANKEANEIIEGLTAVYRDVVKRDPIVNSKAELILLSSVMDKIRGNTSNIKEFFADKSALARRIGENSDNADFFKIPTIIAIYMLVYEDDLYIKRTWPFDSRDNVLEMIFTDLGKSLARD
jgi:putative GTP pyrophosphokinase